MQTKLSVFLFVLLALVMVFQGCEYSTVTPISPVKDQQVSYQLDIQIPIFDEKCLSCHMPGTAPPDLSSGNSYNSLFSGGFIDSITPSQSNLYKAMISGGSMSSYCNASDAQTVLTWITQGAKNN